MAENNALEQLTAQTKTATSMTRRAADEARMKEMDSLRKEMLEAVKSRDKKQLDLVNKRLDVLIKEERQEKKALVDALKGLSDAGKALGVDINVAEKPTQQELDKLAAATNALEEAQKAETAIKAKPPLFFRKSRTDAAVKAAKTATTRLEQVKIDNARAVAQRLDNIDVEEASQHLIGVSKHSQEALKERRAVIQTEIASAGAEITRVEALDKELAGRLDALIDEVSQCEQAHEDAKVDLSRIDSVTDKELHSDQSIVERAAEDALKIARTERDAAMEVRNQVQQNLEFTKIHLAGQRDIQSALKVFQETMEEQLNGLVVQYKSRVEAARALADLKFGSDVHATGTAVMESFADYMAKAGSAANEEVAQMAEDQPEAIRRARETRAEQEAASASTQARIDAVFADMERNYELPEDAAA